MNGQSKNLRTFFGVEAVLVWSKYRDIQRAERSIAVYSNVMDALRNDLKAENSRRGTLVRLRSNEVTGVKEKLSKVESSKSELLKTKRDKIDKIDTFLARLETRVKSWFAASDSIEKIKEDIGNLGKEEDKIQKEILKISDELADAVFKQNAAVDPIEDLEFALEYLEDEIDNCRFRQKDCREYIFAEITKKCMTGGPLVLDIMALSGIEVESPEVFSELYLKIHEKAVRLCYTPVKRETIEVVPVEQGLVSGMSTRTFDVKGNVNLSGTGSHHRKVRRGKNRVWRKFDVTFSGSTSVTIHYEQNFYRLGTAHDTLKNQAVSDFNEGRNKRIELLDESSNKSISELKKWSAQLFEMLISR